MRILDWSTLDRPARRAALERPQLSSRLERSQEAQAIIEAVRREGDAALRFFTRKLDGASPDSLSVAAVDFDRARTAIGPANLEFLRRAITNIERFHQAQVPTARSIEIEPGVRCEQITRAIRTVGLYVPGGLAPLPSTVLMLAVTARVAGCPQRVLCTPPQKDGSIHPAILAAAQLCGIDTVFKVGGAQAIAAMAYGTESIPKVDKLFGPGNAWVTAAKQIVAQDPAGAACDLPAGPSEVLVVADGGARADFVAADLLAQAEHDPLAQAILITDNTPLAQEVLREVRLQQPQLLRGAILKESLVTSRCIVVPDLDTALTLANDYAPEHLILQVREPRHWLSRVHNAGSVFLGAWSPEPLGDYCSGTNHVLPTYGTARTYSGLTVSDFLRTISVQEISPEGLYRLGPTAVALAELEGLDGHAQAVRRRLAVLRSSMIAAKELKAATS